MFLGIAKALRTLAASGALLCVLCAPAYAATLTFTQPAPGTVIATVTLASSGCGGIGAPTSITQSGNQFQIDSPMAVPPPGCVPGPVTTLVLTATLPPPGGTLADGTYLVDWTAGGGTILVAQGSFTIAAGALLAGVSVPALDAPALIVLALLILGAGFASLARPSRPSGRSAAR